MRSIEQEMISTLLRTLLMKNMAIILLWERKVFDNLKTRVRARPIKSRAPARLAKSSEYRFSVGIHYLWLEFLQIDTSINFFNSLFQ